MKLIDMDIVYRQDAVEALKNAELLVRNFGYYKAIETIKLLPFAQLDTTQLAQEIWTKVYLITDPEDANIQHEVIHYGDLKKVFLEVLGWKI